MHPLPGRDLTWTREALPVQAVVGAAIAEPGTVPDTWRSFTVAVVTRDCTVRYAAFTTDRWQERYATACTHHVGATTAEEAKSRAIEEHRATCLRLA